ncbi:MAG: tRNA (guanosine(37)-N1)-methyltransferase TrmD [Pontimonas sp.]
MTLRVDVVSIFPDYFSPLDLSLIGKAVEQELVSVTVHDLREVTTDRHRTVDDTPYGGGAGMVMMPEPWGVMLDSLLTPESTLVVPTPAGVRFTQSMAEDFSRSQHLVFACGRYEGIDQRVVEHFRDRCHVVEVTIGDYVLNGGEVATLVMLEAAIRLVPGVLGNPESLVEESHQDGLVEYPSYTKPAQWRGMDVPDVLLSGNHAEIAAWREQQSRERTKRNRPDLLN